MLVEKEPEALFDFSLASATATSDDSFSVEGFPDLVAVFLIGDFVFRWSGLVRCLTAPALLPKGVNCSDLRWCA